MQDVLVVPVVEGALRDLEVGALDAARDLQKEGNLDLLKLLRLDDVQYFFNLVQEHDLLWAVGLGPESKEA